MLRALESIGVFEQVSPRVFANTDLGEALRKDIPGSQWAGIRLAFSTDVGEFEAWVGLLGSIQTGRIAFNQVRGYSFWEFLDRNPQQRAIFGEAMRSYSEAVTPAITAAYDWGRFSVIADIGGGIGTQLVDILNAHPSCRGVLFDQPGTVTRAIPHERVECVGGSFFERVPAGVDVYFLRLVIHDWSDEEAVAILKTIRAAAKPDSEVVLIEQVIQDTPEYALSKWLDLTMLTVSGGRERTAGEYRQLLDMAGLQVQTIMPTRSPFSLIVALPRA